MPAIQTRKPTRQRARAVAGPVAMEFLQALSAIQGQIEVTTREGASVALAEGLARGIGLIEACATRGRKLMFVGNGGSAAIASHQAVDYWKNGGVKAVAFNDPSFLKCLSNDYGYERVFAEPIQGFADSGDLLIAISSSGRSANILQAAEAARQRGCEVLTLSGFDATNPLRTQGSLNFYIPSHGYGVVEVTHLTLLHAMLDELMARRKAAAPPA